MSVEPASVRDDRPAGTTLGRRGFLTMLLGTVATVAVATESAADAAPAEDLIDGGTP